MGEKGGLFLQESGFAAAKIHSTTDHPLAQSLTPARGELLCEAHPIG